MSAVAPLISFPCPNCSRNVKAPRTAVGRKGTCRRCGAVFTVKAPADDSVGLDLLAYLAEHKEAPRAAPEEREEPADAACPPTGTETSQRDDASGKRRIVGERWVLFGVLVAFVGLLLLILSGASSDSSREYLSVFGGLLIVGGVSAAAGGLHVIANSQPAPEPIVSQSVPEPIVLPARVEPVAPLPQTWNTSGDSPFFDGVEQAAQTLAVIGYVVCALTMVAGLILLVRDQTPDAGRAVAVGIMVAGAVGILAARVQVGVVLLLVDIARSLRVLRNQGLTK